MSFPHLLPPPTSNSSPASLPADALASHFPEKTEASEELPEFSTSWQLSRLVPTAELSVLRSKAGHPRACELLSPPAHLRALLQQTSPTPSHQQLSSLYCIAPISMLKHCHLPCLRNAHITCLSHWLLPSCNKISQKCCLRLLPRFSSNSSPSRRTSHGPTENAAVWPPPMIPRRQVQPSVLGHHLASPASASHTVDHPLLF